MGHLDISRKEFEKMIKEVLPQGLPNPKMLLDVGCRDDENREFFKKLNIKWVGVDLVPKEHVIRADMNDLPFADGEFSFIFASHSFEHTENPVQTLREFKRVLCAGGVVFMNTPYPSLNQLFAMDKQHIFCLNKLQIERLFFHCGIIPLKTELYKEDERNEDTWQIITIGRVI